ncbi:hypothetical protein HPHPA9_0149 [Helicobacter pylori Hp A-9]|uniref:Uncharacterized protein n=1 Tax=Helicobacter pylori Hp A-9 TaxID=992034 RepID=I9RHQ0_HELPX|nr:hypothetical protein HPHPA9_0149 [Helicobacter pylori Hp A-9]
MPNYLKLTLNYLHVFTITPTYTQRYILKYNLLRFCSHQAWITKANFNHFSLQEFIA